MPGLVVGLLLRPPPVVLRRWPTLDGLEALSEMLRLKETSEGKELMLDLILDVGEGDGTCSWASVGMVALFWLWRYWICGEAGGLLGCSVIEGVEGSTVSIGAADVIASVGV
jgi:hypothetical protein